MEVSNEYGCKKRDSIQVTVNTSPTPTITYNTDLEIICWDSTIILDAGAGYSSYRWHNGATTQTLTTPHLPEYYVVVTDTNNCTDSTNIYIDCSPIIRVFNLFTPNSDSHNDVFFVEGLKPNKWSLEIYSKWGSRIYYNQNYDNSFSGSELETGVYFYILTHVLGEKSYKGWVHIVKSQ